MRWPWQSSNEVREERERTKRERDAMLEKLIMLDHERDALDLMVKRSLKLLEGRKP